jgi:hypothetical protein
MHREILPASPILAAHGDSQQLVEELATGEIDVAVDVLSKAPLECKNQRQSLKGIRWRCGFTTLNPYISWK